MQINDDVPIVYFLLQSLLEKGEQIYYLRQSFYERQVVQKIVASYYNQRCYSLNISFGNKNGITSSETWAWTVPDGTDNLILKKIDNRWMLYDDIREKGRSFEELYRWYFEILDPDIT